MLELRLAAATRPETGKKVSGLRRAGIIPGVVYGHSLDPRSIALNASEFERVFRQAGESTLIDVVIDDQPAVKVLVQDLQRDPRTEQIIHVDLHQVNMSEKLKASIELKFIGEAPAIKELHGILVTPLDTLEVECLPKDLVHEIDVDLSSLVDFDHRIHVSDLPIPAGLTVLAPADEVVALVQPPRSEEEMKDLEQAPTVAAGLPEVVGKEPVAETEEKTEE